MRYYTIVCPPVWLLNHVQMITDSFQYREKNHNITYMVIQLAGVALRGFNDMMTLYTDKGHKNSMQTN